LDKRLSIKLYKNNDLYLNLDNVNYQKINEKYRFQIEDISHTLLINKQELVLIRENVESRFELTIRNNGLHACKYLLKELDAYVDINVDSAEYSLESNHLELYYQLESDDKFTRIEIHF